MKRYAGIGSRSTPTDVLNIMTNIATWLREKGYVLRSGGAVGADTAFEQGCDDLKEIYYAIDANITAMAIAKKYHPAWERCSDIAKKLHARNAFQILGASLNDPVDFVICWTPDGCETHEDRTSETGGTGTAISIANATGIPVYNLANQDSIQNLRELLKTIK